MTSYFFLFAAINFLNFNFLMLKAALETLKTSQCIKSLLFHSYSHFTHQDIFFVLIKTAISCILFPINQIKMLNSIIKFFFNKYKFSKYSCNILSLTSAHDT